jgi:hypothetical protein
VPAHRSIDTLWKWPWKSILLVVAVASFSILVSRVWVFTVDDSFITFRYARNLAAGNGPNYNADERAEGYTSFLWLLVLTPIEVAGLPVEVSSKVIGVLLTLGWALLARHFTRRGLALTGCPDDGTLPAAATLLLLTFPATAIHAVSGMETALFTFLLLWFCYQLMRGGDDWSFRAATILAFSGLFLGLARPEGNIAAIVGLGVAMALTNRRGRAALLAAAGLFYLVPGAVYFLWRLHYYQHLFPLPFYVKVAGRSLAGLSTELSFLATIIGYLGLPLLLFAIGINRRFLALTGAAASLGVFLLFPAPLMAYDYRYLFPTLPLLVVLSSIGVGKIVRKASALGAVSAKKAGLFAALLLVFPSLGLAGRYAGWVGDARGYGHDLRNAHVALGEKLRALGELRPGLKLAIADAGAVPFLSTWNTLDTFGLNSPEIAVSGQHDSRTVMKWNPNVLVLISNSQSVFNPPLRWERAFLAAATEAGMVRVGVLRFNDSYYLWLLAQPDDPIARDLKQWAGRIGASG